ncbi:MAG: class I SAM-dependent methyltransferase, partial [Desulfuromusa sp.]|nr:class I SAM-dependent methyltransferase [Desulfuromusa sp.]
MQVVSSELQRRLPVTSESRRLFHGRGHCFPGYEDLLIDWFCPVVLISLYAPRNQQWLQTLLALLQKEIPGATALLLQERFLLNGSVRLLAGERPQNVDVMESGLSYRLRLGQAQNIGFFPDMKDGRALVKTLAAKRKA